MAGVASQKVVKSARRALEVLEYFTHETPEATATTIAKGLDYPISSTFELLWNLVEMGYLTYSPQGRIFTPTIKLPLIGLWVLPTFFRNGTLLRHMDDLAHQTGGKVVLGTREGVGIRYVHAAREGRDYPGMLGRGDARCMLNSAMGRLFLSRFPAPVDMQVARRLNAEVSPDWRQSTAELGPKLAHIRDEGYSLTINHLTPGVGSIAVSLPQAGPRHELALAIGLPSDLLQEKLEFYIDLMRRSTIELKLGAANDVPH